MSQFALAGGRQRRLRKLNAGRGDHAKEHRRKLVEDHVSQKMSDMCCARFPDGREECGSKYCAHVLYDVAKKRVAHVARKLHETNHSSAEKLGVDARLGIDHLHPEGHVSSDCRPGSGSSVTPAECWSRSAVHHLSVKHGLSGEQVQTKLDEYGVRFGDATLFAAQSFGLFREGRHGGDVRPGSPTSRNGGQFTAERAAANAEAARILKKATADASGRRLTQNDDDPLSALARPEVQEQTFGPRSHDPTVGARMMARHYNATRSLGSSIRGLERAHQDATRDARRRKGARTRALPYQSTSIKASNLPQLAWASIQATRGSFEDRFGGAIQAVDAMRMKHSKMYEKHAERQLRRTEEQEARGRKLQERPAVAADIYAHLSEKLNTMPPSKRVHAELPTEHAFSWIHDVVGPGGWVSMFHEGRRLAAVEQARSAMRSDPNTLHSHASIVDRHPTGYEWLDHPEYRPSTIGDALRRLGARKATGSDPAWWNRPIGEEQAPDGTGRRLATAFLAGTLAAPFAAASVVLPSGADVPESKESAWQAGLRYLVGGTVGCYLTKPAEERSATQGATSEEGLSDEGTDGDTLKILRPSAEKLCFPAIYNVLSHLRSFREATGTAGVNFGDLKYSTYCSDDGVRCPPHCTRQLPPS